MLKLNNVHRFCKLKKIGFVYSTEIKIKTETMKEKTKVHYNIQC